MASAGDSYIGSLISLISKYEIRYEGVLYQLNVQDSTIGLKNVRSFGTEGRKRDGPQVLPSDKVYEFILFRGSDIKDLQVKSSPPAKTEEQIPNDPAIIQSQYADESLASPPLASVGKDNLTESTQWKDTPALRNIGYSGTHSSYHSPIQMGSELSSVTPTTMYHQGYPRTLVNSLNPQNHIAAPPAPITSNPLSVQPPLQALEIQTSMNLGSASSSEFRTPVPTTVNLKFSPSFPPMQYPTPLNVPLSASTEASQPSHSISFTANMPTMPTFPFPHQDLVGNETQIVQKAVSNPNQVLPVHTASTEAYLPSDSASLAANAPNLPSFPFSHQDVNTNETQAVHKAVSDPTQPLPVQTMPYSTSSLMGQNLGPLLTPSPSLLRPDNSAHSGSQILPSTQNLYASQQNMGAPVPMPSNTSSRLPVYVTQAPLLPLPSSSQKFTEEFDFEAMNEKFKKDEVWDYLGKAKQVDKGDGGEVNTAGLRLEEKEGHVVATSKAAYNKDDFFDSISCNSLGHGPRKGQDRFSEQMRHSTDSFGFEYRPNRGYGGYGAGRSENFRGPHNWGRGYGYYGGRGRGGNNHF